MIQTDSFHTDPTTPSVQSGLAGTDCGCGCDGDCTGDGLGFTLQSVFGQRSFGGGGFAFDPLGGSGFGSNPFSSFGFEQPGAFSFTQDGLFKNDIPTGSDEGGGLPEWLTDLFENVPDIVCALDPKCRRARAAAGGGGGGDDYGQRDAYGDGAATSAGFGGMTGLLLTGGLVLGGVALLRRKKPTEQSTEA